MHQLLQHVLCLGLVVAVVRSALEDKYARGEPFRTFHVNTAMF